MPLGWSWRELWPKVNKLREPTDVGVALSQTDESKLLSAADRIAQRSPLMPVLVRLALSTGMRAGELTSLTWSQVDLWQRLITVGQAKTNAGTGRVDPDERRIIGGRRQAQDLVHSASSVSHVGALRLSVRFASPQRSYASDRGN